VAGPRRPAKCLRKEKKSAASANDHELCDPIMIHSRENDVVPSRQGPGRRTLVDGRPARLAGRKAFRPGPPAEIV